MYLDYAEVTGLYQVVEEFYRNTSRESATHRFFHPVSDFRPVYAYLWERGCGTFAVYYLNRLVGLVDITPCDDAVEVAIIIADLYQGRGIGMAVALDFAGKLARWGFAYAVAYISPENYKALNIARKMGAEIRCRDLCTIRYQLREPCGVPTCCRN